MTRYTLTVAIAGLTLGLMMLPVLAQGKRELPLSGQFSENQAIQQIMQVIEKTNVQKIDRRTVRSFQEHVELKDSFFKPVQATKKPTRSVKGLPAPKVMEEKTF